MGVKKYSKEELKGLEDETDYEKLKQMTETEIDKNAEDDSDSRTPDDSRLGKFRKVKKDEKKKP